MTSRLSPEALGVLRALVHARRARNVQPHVAEELVARGFAERHGGMIKATDLGRAAVGTDL